MRDGRLDGMPDGGRAGDVPATRSRGAPIDGPSGATVREFDHRADNRARADGGFRRKESIP